MTAILKDLLLTQQSLPTTTKTLDAEIARILAALKAAEASRTRLSQTRNVLDSLGLGWLVFWKKGQVVPMISWASSLVSSYDLAPDGRLVAFRPVWLRALVPPDSHRAQAEAMARGEQINPGPVAGMTAPRPIFGSETDCLTATCPNCGRPGAPLVARFDILKWDLDDSPFLYEISVLCPACSSLWPVACTQKRRDGD